MRSSIGVLALSFTISGAAFGLTYPVNDLGDAPDANPGNGVCATAGAVCTLRAAIEEANAFAGPDTITFAIDGLITPATLYPAIIGQTDIDGTTAPGGAQAVDVDGGGSLSIGLSFGAGSAGSRLFGMQVSGFTSAGVSISSIGGVTVLRNLFTANTGDGIEVSGTGHTIGGTDGNMIIGNQRYGILVYGSGHTISDNLIGIDNFDSPFPNLDDGIHVFSLATNITIGGSAGRENVISGNGGDGVEIDNSSGITVAGNYIGTDAAGTVAVPNSGNGVLITDSNNNFIGLTGSITIISGNGGDGIWIQQGSTGNTVDACFIGVDAAGTTALGNFGNGITVDAANNIIGTPPSGNVVSGNGFDGVSINDSNVMVQANLIGTFADGTTILGNGGAGVSGQSASTLLIGGSTAGEGNLISGNDGCGITFAGVSTSRIEGNTIGLDAAGTAAVPNGSGGVSILDSSDDTIGAPGNGMNVISGNFFDGIAIFAGPGMVIQNNRLGTNRAGTAAIGNEFTGAALFGTTGAIVRSNLISGNDSHGVEILFGVTGTVIHSNIVGLAVDLLTPLPNNGDGINVCDGAADSVVGSVALGGNTIANNVANGIGVEPTALQNNSFVANSIYNNSGLGIDIDIDGVTANDLDDPDTGANNLQNFPTLTWTVASPTQTTVEGSLNSLAVTTYAIHFYSNVAADPSGNGEGQTYLGTTNVTTDAGGDGTFSFTGPAAPVGAFITATATGVVDGTSEFSVASIVTAAPTVQFSAATYSVGESGGSATITVTRTGDLTGTSTVVYATSNGTAADGADYTGMGGTLIFAPTVNSQTFNVPITNDTLNENNETVNLTLSAPNAATLGAQSTAVLTIIDDDPLPSLSINDVTLNEGNAGVTPFVFTVTLSPASGRQVTVNFATADGTATAGTDYTATSGMLTFAPGVLAQTITVNVIGDTTTEPNKTFFVNLTVPTNATIADAQGIGTIVNDDAIPSITINDVSQNEGNAGTTPFIFTVTLSNPSASTITVNYATADGTATAGADYIAVSGMLTFAPGVLTQPITVNVTGETTAETNETFFVNLTLPTNATIARAQGIGTIINDDGIPSLTINDVTQNEGNAGPTPFIFTVTLSNLSASTITVDYATADGTATTTDYTAVSGTLTFAPGVLTQTITVNVTGDTTSETNETFFVNLTNATNASIARAQGVGTINNDEVAVGADVSISKSAFAEGTKVTYTIVVANAGPATATGVTMTDVIEPRSQVVSATSTSGTCTGTTTVICSIPTLASGSSATITIVLQSLYPGMPNTATVSANEPDPNPANNTVTSLVNIPTLSEWMLLALIAALGMVAMIKLR